MYIKHNALKVTEWELAKCDLIVGESLEDYGKVLANLAKKVFLDDAGEKMK